MLLVIIVANCSVELIEHATPLLVVTFITAKWPSQCARLDDLIDTVALHLAEAIRM
jgi:hypothetical protein